MVAFMFLADPSALAYKAYAPGAEIHRREKCQKLYERLGGIFAITAVVDHFSDAREDEVLAAFAAHKSDITGR